MYRDHLLPTAFEEEEDFIDLKKISVGVLWREMSNEEARKDNIQLARIGLGKARCRIARDCDGIGADGQGLQ